MELKYTTLDTWKLIDAFSKISESRNDPTMVAEEMKKLMNEYPNKIIETFIHCINMMAEKHDEEFVKDNYSGMIGYITMRLNFV